MDNFIVKWTSETVEKKCHHNICFSDISQILEVLWNHFIKSYWLTYFWLFSLSYPAHLLIGPPNRKYQTGNVQKAKIA